MTMPPDCSTRDVKKLSSVSHRSSRNAPSAKPIMTGVFSPGAAPPDDDGFFGEKKTIPHVTMAARASAPTTQRALFILLLYQIRRFGVRVSVGARNRDVSGAQDPWHPFFILAPRFESRVDFLDHTPIIQPCF